MINWSEYKHYKTIEKVVNGKRQAIILFKKIKGAQNDNK